MKRHSTRLALSLLLFALVSSALPRVGARAAAQGEEKRYIVIYNSQSSIPKNADRGVAQAGGQVLARLDQVGALVATSTSPTFAADLPNVDAQVSDVAEDIPVQMIPTPIQMGVLNADDLDAQASNVEPPGDDTQTGSEPFYRFQWDKKRMRASNQGSYAVQRGRPDVLVAVLDTGSDILPVPHQDIASRVNFSLSRSFFPVSPNPDGNPAPAAWDDKNGHGSWCHSAVAAPINGRGISGVAPNVTLVTLKVLGDNGSGSFVALAQALIYAGVHKFDVASMSLGAYLNHTDQSSHAVIKLLQRAVNFARENGVTPIVAIGNDSFDLSDGNFFQDFIEVPGEKIGRAHV